MRSLITFGVISLFLGSAFITPTEANVLAMVVHVRDQAQTPAAKAKISSATSALIARAPHPSVVARRVLQSVLRPSAITSPEWKQLMAQEKNPTIHSFFETIDWASRKRDARLCMTLDPSLLDRTTFIAPTVGDLLALCLAKATADPNRCSQIDPITGAQLRSVCEGELVRQA